MLRFLSFILFAFVIGATPAIACGYDFVGGCSSEIHLKVNNTEGIFAIAPCQYETAFNGLQLGTIRDLNISGASAITWESCINNVTNIAVYYRLYPVGQSAGAVWNNFDVPESSNTLEGPYTTRYRNANTNLNLTNGLVVGSNYVLEVYLRAEIDTIGDDFIPETFLLQNNNGANYTLGFKYGGPAAPALVVVPTQKENVTCWGKSTGVAGVTVFGGQPNASLFYQWSAFTSNFFQIDSLPAGTYTVTVTETPGGNTATTSITISQPALPISLSFTNVTPVTCNMAASATVNPSGGTGTLSWEWSNGDTLQTTHFATEGIYAITITDDNACTQKGMLTITGSGTAHIFELPTICYGQVHTRGGQSFTQSGLYSVTVPAPNGCDTLVDFYLTVLDPGTYLATLPETESVSCAQPLKELCAQTGSDVTFEWQKDGLPYGSTPCITLSAGGNYHIQSAITHEGKTCVADKSIAVSEHLDAGSLQVVGNGHSVHCQDSMQFSLWANYPQPLASILWMVNGDTLSVTDSVTFTVLPTITPAFALQITDIYGCSATATSGSILITQPSPLTISGAEQHSNCLTKVEVELQVSGGEPPYQYTWSNGSTENPTLLFPGLHYATVMDAAGCEANVTLIAEAFIAMVSPNSASSPTATDGSVSLNIMGSGTPPFSIQWNTGDTAVMSLTGLAPGFYCATVTDANGCARTGCTDVTYPLSTTQPFETNSGLLLYPNPVVCGEWVHFDNKSVSGTWNLLNSVGQVCDYQVLVEGQTSVQIPETLPEGIYSVIVKNLHFSQVDKIFLQKRR
jgi:hypothetical protein